MPLVALGLGSNRGYGGLSPTGLLLAACRRLGSFLRGMEVSSVYRTAAMYVTRQDDFYNMAVLGAFGGTPRQLLALAHGVEAALGRDRLREQRNGPRSLDVDIELFGREQVREEGLVVPHERLCERAFVLIPLLEILPEHADVSGSGAAFYRERLAALSGQRVERCLGRADFLRMLSGEAAGAKA